MNRAPGRSAFAALIACTGLAVPATAQLRVCAWNISNYGGAHATRDPGFRTALFATYSGRRLAPDVVIAQEITSAAGAAAFLANLNATSAGSPGDYALAPFIDGPDTDLAFYYRTSKVNFLSQTLVIAGGDTEGAPRDIRRYDIRPAGYFNAGATLALYGAHMKAGDTSTDRARRLVESTAIRGNANALPAAWHHLFGGDTNIPSSTQDAYKELIDAVPPVAPTPNTPRGQFFDPIKSPGTWNNNSAFRFIHTQAPGTHPNSAGMDDRFDFLLVGAGLIDGKGFEYIGNASLAYSTSTWNDTNHSYRAWGNDGTTINNPIAVATNQMVGAAIAQGLIDSCSTDASGGHLPVFIDLRVPAVVGAPGTINLGSVSQNAPAQTTLTVSNAGNVGLWTAQGIATLQYTLSASSGVTAPAGAFNAAPGAAGNGHTITIDTSTAGPFAGTVTILPTVGDTPALVVTVEATILPVASCYANCDGSTTPPVLNVSDFSCFLVRYAASDPWANCDESTSAPMLNVSDFTCFLQKYAAGCP